MLVSNDRAFGLSFWHSRVWPHYLQRWPNIPVLSCDWPCSTSHHHHNKLVSNGNFETRKRKSKLLRNSQKCYITTLIGKPLLSPYINEPLEEFCHGQKCIHLFPDSEAYHEQMGPYSAQMEA